METKPKSGAHTVGEFMTRGLCVADTGLPIDDAMERMMLNRIRHLVVLENKKLVGVVSSRDLGFATGFPGIDTKVAELGSAITGPAQVCEQDAPVGEVARVMEEHRFGCVVVVDDGEPVGIFTTTDALRALRQLATGEVADRPNPPTHQIESDPEAFRTGHYVRAADSCTLKAW